VLLFHRALRNSHRCVLDVLEDCLTSLRSMKSMAFSAVLTGMGSGCSDVDMRAPKASNTSIEAGSSNAAGSAGPELGTAGSMEDAADGGPSIAPPSAAGTWDRGARTEPWRVVPLGDSITEGGCTTQLLWQALHERGATNFDLVGTKHSGEDCGVSGADRDNEGHSGYLATDLVDEGPHAAELSQWCQADRGDVVLMHLGTNDIWHGASAPEPILSAFSKVLAALRAAQPRVIVFVAQIIPMSPRNCPECSGRVPLLNAALPAWAASASRADSPVYVVDQFSGFDTATDTAEGVHPNRQGAQKLADNWAAALMEREIFY
jgi:lysophospholipase L1-like esterase